MPRDCQHYERPHHDCDYVERRNRIIPEAIDIADRKTRAIRFARDDARQEHWNTVFHRAMNRLYRERYRNGVRS